MDINLSEFCGGLTFYVSYGDWGGFSFDKDESAYRICLGYFSICFLKYDVENLVVVLNALLDDHEGDLPISEKHIPDKYMSNSDNRNIKGGTKPKKPDSIPSVDNTPKPPTSGGK